MTVRPKADWAELDLLVGQPTFLEDMTSRELRAIVAEFVEEIAYRQSHEGQNHHARRHVGPNIASRAVMLPQPG